SDSNGRGTGNVSSRLGDDAHALGQLVQRRTQRCAEATDVLHRFAVVDRKSAADVERIKRTELLPARGGHELGASMQRLDVFGRVARLRADMERQSAHL